MVDCPDRCCPVCKTPMTGRQKSGCSGKCRAELSRLKRKEDALVALEATERALRTLRRTLHLGDEP